MQRRKARIVVVGSANIDLTTFTDEFPRPGETLFGKDFDLGFGGKGANQAIAAAYCGAEVHMVARVGDDLFGPASLRNFKDCGIGQKHVKIVKGVASGVAPIFVDNKGQNRIVVVKGANDKLTPSAVKKARKLLETANMIVLQFEIPLETIYYTIRFAEQRNIPVLLNPAPALRADLKKLQGVDYFIPNETEASTIIGKPVKSISDAKQCAHRLLSKGFRRTIITLGERGAVLATRYGVDHVPTYPIAALDSTGAGDAFIGSFATFLTEGFDERDAITRASLYAALSTTRVGAQKSYVKRKRFDREWKNRTK